MKYPNSVRKVVLSTLLAAMVASPLIALPGSSHAFQGGGSGGGSAKVDTIKVSKCFYDVGSGQMLMKASSSDSTAHLYAYRPDGTYQGEVQNGGGSRYCGTFMGWISYDPKTMTIRSSSGGSITVPTTPFQL